MGFGARDFVHGANAAKPKKLRSWAADEVKIHFLREKEILKHSGKVNVKKPARATPRGHVAFVRFRPEMWAKRSGRFCDFGVRILVIVEGRATKEGRKKKTGRTKKEEEQQESKKSKFDPYTP